MPLYEFECYYCGDKFEQIKPMAERALHDCPKCGQLAPLVPSVFYDLWGIILTEQSHHKGAKDTWVSNRPSNEMEVDDTKAPYKKTIY